MSSNSVKKITGKRIRDIFFSQGPDDSNSWVCKCGRKRRVTGTGYSNFISHVRDCHKFEYEAACNGAVSRDNGNQTNEISTQEKHSEISDSSFLWKPLTVNICGWMELIVDNLLPISSCENSKLLPHVKYDKVDTDTFKKYLKLLTKLVEKKIKSQLPDKFCLTFDGWSHQGTYFIALFATFSCAKSSNGYKAQLLGFSPLLDETSHSANEHISLISFILNLFGKNWNNVIAIIADNCAVNKAIARKVKCEFVGCSSHRFNLAIKDVVLKSMPLVERVRSIMGKLQHPIRRAKLREHTDLAPIKSCDTRWSSVSQMLNRYMKMKDHLEASDIDEIQELILERKENQEIETLMHLMKSLDSITICLQRDNAKLSEVRVLFDTVINLVPELNDRLKSDADIVECINFETAVSKIQSNRSEDLTEEEKDSVKCLKRVNDSICDIETFPKDLASQALASMREAQNLSNDYVDLRFILPSSNICERLFSLAKLLLRDNRSSLSPDVMECLIFLLGNRELWSISDVNTVVS